MWKLNNLSYAGIQVCSPEQTQHRRGRESRRWQGRWWRWQGRQWPLQAYIQAAEHRQQQCPKAQQAAAADLPTPAATADQRGWNGATLRPAEQ